MTVDNQLVTHEGLGLSVGRYVGLFYASYGVVGSQDMEWLQVALNVFISLFPRYELVAYVAKSKAMTC